MRRTTLVLLLLVVASFAVLAPIGCGSSSSHSNGSGSGSGTPSKDSGTSAQREGGTDGGIVDSTVTSSESGGGDGALMACSSSTCTNAGYSCVSGQCTADCRPESANACATGSVCDYTDGTCKSPDAEGVLAGSFAPCGVSVIPVVLEGGVDASVEAGAAQDAAPDAGPVQWCGPGTACTANGTCAADSPCTAVTCDPAGHCWGSSCPLTRPSPTCVPATLAELNVNDFMGVAGGEEGYPGEGAIGLEFDDLCNAYIVTLISGPDYLRTMSPAGTITSYEGNTNLNMGEVSVLRSQDGLANQNQGQIALTYICCATCGCEGPPQGVAHLVADGGAMDLPLVIDAVTTTGMGPFTILPDAVGYDTGPYGLTWGRDRTLYVGDVNTNGDYYQVNLTTGSTRLLTTLPARVIASTALDYLNVLVAVEGGQVYEVNVVNGSSKAWTTLPEDATSLRRDPYTGLVYVELAGNAAPAIVQLDPDGTAMTSFQTPPSAGRIAIAPDGYLYHLNIHPGPESDTTLPSVVRWALPATR